MKAPTEDEREQPPESAYTGMTAALVEAMRERRKSFQDSEEELLATASAVVNLVFFFLCS